MKSQYTKEKADLIIKELEAGKTLLGIVKTHPELPSYSAVMRWRKAHPEFGEAYLHAREVQIELFVDQILQIANGPPPIGYKDKTELSAIQGQRRLQVDTIKFVAAKLAPRIFGDKLSIEENNKVTVTVRNFADNRIDELPDERDVTPTKQTK